MPWVRLAAPFADSGVLDTRTCMVVWDDGTADTHPAYTGSTCDRARTFAYAGLYTIEVTVTDDAVRSHGR